VSRPLPVYDINQFAILVGEVIGVTVVIESFSGSHLLGGNLHDQRNGEERGRDVYSTHDVWSIIDLNIPSLQVWLVWFRVLCSTVHRLLPSFR